MTVPENKPFYKVISLFIKSAILFFSFYFIWKRLKDTPVDFDLPVLFAAENSFFTIAIIVFMFLNWSLEAIKWKLLIAPLEKITFSASLKAVFSGVTVSIYTPNRVGEFVGRVFFLEKADKIQATIRSLIGSFIQLFVTILAGILGFFILEKKYFDFFDMPQFFSEDYFFLLLVVLIAVVVIIVFVIIKRKIFYLTIAKYMEIFKRYTLKELNAVFCLSIIRYIVFSFQYYFALRLFGISGGPVVLFSLIALTFLVTSAIPTFALTEIAVRAGVAVCFFGMISSANSSILAASLFLWIINLAVPALFGSPFIWQLRFFNR
jgi:uncharacterized membrane protein YbhN (UPF0104 family)